MNVKMTYSKTAGTWDYRVKLATGERMVAVGFRSHTAAVTAMADAVAEVAGVDAGLAAWQMGRVS